MGLKTSPPENSNIKEAFDNFFLNERKNATALGRIRSLWRKTNRFLIIGLG